MTARKSNKPTVPDTADDARITAQNPFLRTEIRANLSVQGFVIRFIPRRAQGSSRRFRKPFDGYADEFQLVDQTVKKGDAIISVRLVHKPEGKPVPDAVIFATRLDMTPDGMQEMATKIAPMPSTEPGIYKFKATVSMAGGWQLSLGAKVQGETGTVESKLALKATP